MPGGKCRVPSARCRFALGKLKKIFNFNPFSNVMKQEIRFCPQHPELGTRNMEPGTWHPELGTRNLAPGTWNSEPGTPINKNTKRFTQWKFNPY
jgi:hypothetical protein